MLHFIICDDDASFSQRLREYIDTFCSGENRQYSLLSFSSGNALIENIPKEADIILMDIQMPGCNGIDTAKELRKTFPDACLIFITNLPQYALKSYEARPFGFLTKPLSYDRFSQEIQTAVSRLDRISPLKPLVVRLKDSDALYTLQIPSVLYFEVKDHYIHAHIKDRTIVFKGRMTDLADTLKDLGFIRCHNSYLVNCLYISEITASTVTVEHDELPISRSRKQEFITGFLRNEGRRL